MIEPDHWLWRLDTEGWLAAADHELAHGEAKMGSRRAAIAHARRAAGMALNAVLVGRATSDDATKREIEKTWGRSYLEHLRVVAEGDPARLAPLPVEASTSARALLAISVDPPPLIQLGSRATDVRAALDRAREIVEQCRRSTTADGSCA